MSQALRDQILLAGAARRRQVEPVDAFGVAGTFVRVMSGTERDDFEQSVTGDDGKVERRGFRVKLVAKCLCDGDGVALFTDADVAALAELDAVELDRVFAVAQKKNALTKRDVDALSKN